MVDNTGDRSPWPALWALCVGFFMILVDTTIVSVATPTILADLRTDVDPRARAETLTIADFARIAAAR